MRVPPHRHVSPHGNPRLLAPARASSSIPVLALLMSLSALMRCHDTPPTGAAAPEIRLPSLRTTVVGCNGGPCDSLPLKPWSRTFQLGAGDLSGRDSSEDVLTFDMRTRVQIKVEGTISRRYIDEISPAWSHLEGTTYPPLDANAEWLGSNKSGFVYTDFQGTDKQNATVIGSSPNSPTSGQVQSFTFGPTVVRGTGRVRRFAFQQPSTPGPPTCGGSGGVRCVITAGGSQQVTIEVVSMFLTLTAVPDSITVGDNVTFTASASGLAVNVKGWRWVPSAGDAFTSTADCSTSSSTCTIPVFESGTMHVLASIGSGSSAVVERADASVKVDISACTKVAGPADSLRHGLRALDVKAIRDSLNALFNASRPSPTDSSTWREQAGWILRDSSTGAFSFVRAPSTSATICEIAAPITPSLAAVPALGITQFVVGWVHTHPVDVGKKFAGSLCATNPPISTSTLEAGSGYGLFSGRDLSNFRSYLTPPNSGNEGVDTSSVVSVVLNSSQLGVLHRPVVLDSTLNSVTQEYDIFPTNLPQFLSQSGVQNFDRTIKSCFVSQTPRMD